MLVAETQPPERPGWILHKSGVGQLATNCLVWQGVGARLAMLSECTCTYIHTLVCSVVVITSFLRLLTRSRSNGGIIALNPTRMCPARVP